MGKAQKIIIVIVIILAGGFFGYQYLKLQKIREEAKPLSTETTTLPSSSSEQPKTTEIDTTGWKTYRNENEKYGFEFKYPSSWQRGASKQGGLYLDGKQEGHIEILFRGDDLNFSDRPANLNPAELEKYKMNLDQFWTAYSESQSEAESNDDAFHNIKKTRLNGYNAYEIDVRTMVGEYRKPDTYHEEIFFMIFVENETGYIYQINFEDRLNKDALTKYERQILSTFKFIK